MARPRPAEPPVTTATPLLDGSIGSSLLCSLMALPIQRDRDHPSAPSAQRGGRPDRDRLAAPYPSSAVRAEPGLLSVEQSAPPPPSNLTLRAGSGAGNCDPATRRLFPVQQGMRRIVFGLALAASLLLAGCTPAQE